MRIALLLALTCIAVLAVAGFWFLPSGGAEVAPPLEERADPGLEKGIDPPSTRAEVPRRAVASFDPSSSPEVSMPPSGSDSTSTPVECGSRWSGTPLELVVNESDIDGMPHFVAYAYEWGNRRLTQVGSWTGEREPDPGPVRIMADAIGPITGTARDAAGAIVRDFGIGLKRRRGEGVVVDAGETWTSRKGQFLADALAVRADERIELYASSPRHAPTAPVLIFDRGQWLRREVVFTFDSMRSRVVGRTVLPDGTPAGDGLSVHSGPPWRVVSSAAVASDGSFEILGLEAGRYELRIRALCLDAAPARALVVPTADAQVDLGTLVVTRPTHAYVVRIVDLQGAPIEHAQLAADGVDLG